MKKLLKKVNLIMLFIMISLFITGCGNDDYYGSSQNVRDCYDAGYCKSVWK